MKYLLSLLLVATPLFAAEKYTVPADLVGKTMTIVAPVPVGSTIDIVTRAFAKAIAEQVGDQMKIVTVNRPGANGNIAIQSVVSADPNSLTVCFCDNNTVMVNPLLKLPGSIEFKDISPVSSIAEGYMIVIAPGSAPYNTLPELVEFMNKTPQRNIFGASLGTMALSVWEIIDRAGMKNTEVITYKGGAETMLAVARGDIPAAATGMGDTFELVRAGKLKFIAVSSERRLSILPHVPTISETFPGVTARTTMGIYTSHAMPLKTQQSLNVIWSQSLKNPDIVTLLTSQGRTILDGDLASSQKIYVKHLNDFKPLVDGYGKHLKSDK